MKIKDSGKYDGKDFWKTWYEGSKRLGTPINDIRPRNIGKNGIIFDPAIDQPIFWGAVSIGTPTIGTSAYYLKNFFSEYFNEKEEE